MSRQGDGRPAPGADDGPQDHAVRRQAHVLGWLQVHRRVIELVRIDAMPGGGVSSSAGCRASALRACKITRCANHLHLGPDQDLRLRAPGAEARRPRDPQGRDLRAARAQRRRQDDADQHRLRHRHADGGHGARRRPRHRCATIAPRARRSAWCRRSWHRRVRDGVGDGDASAAACSAARRTRRTSRRCCATCRCGTSATTRS